MKRLSVSFLFILFIFAQPLHVHAVIPLQTAQPSQWLAWIKSVRVPKKEDILKAKAYAQSKWRCARYGENCSVKERAALISLGAIVTALIATLVSRKIGAYQQQALSTDNPLLNASWQKEEKAINTLLEEGANPNSTTITGMTPLMLLVSKPKMVKKLLEKGANPNIADKAGMTAIMHAASVQEDETIELLLHNKNFDINAHAQGAWVLGDALGFGIIDNSSMKVAKMLSPYIDIIKDEYGETGVGLLNIALKNELISQEQYDQLMRYSRGKKEFKAALTPKEKNILYTLPLELRAKVFEDVTGMPLSEKQKRKIMQRSGENKK